jgi:putative ABC transport system substrate-binding protein
VNRRCFLIALGAAAAAPIRRESEAAERVPLVAVLRASSFSQNDPVTGLIESSLGALGYVRDRSMRIEQFSGRNQEERLPLLAQEAAARGADVIVATTAVAALAARKATSTVPIVFVANDQDPVSIGLVTSLARPGGNATGIFSLQPQLIAKRFELLRELIPDLSTVAVLNDPAVKRTPEGLAAAAEMAKVRLQPIGVRWPEDFPRAFKSVRRAGATLVLFSSMFQANRAALARAALQARMPTICPQRSFVEAGALLSYAADRPAMAARVAYFIDRILKGAKPADLPVEQAAKFELVVNARTANGLKIAVPPSILARADEVIE